MFCEKSLRSAIRGIALLIIAYTARGAATKEIQVKIVNRQNSSTEYSYVIPGYSTTNSNNLTSCYGDTTSVNCSGNTRTTTAITPSRSGSYAVQGATFTLLLPDGRAAVVNCSAKYAPRGDYVNKRSCRMPLTDEVMVEFNGSKAKLRWVVSLDGKKTVSETYKIVAVLDKVLTQN